MEKSQGALEYLLLIGGAVVVAAVVTVGVLGLSSTSVSTTSYVAHELTIKKVMTLTGSGWWKLDGDGTDGSGNGNNATTTNGVTWIFGKYGNAAEFDSSSDYVQIPNSGSLNPPNFTVAAWVFPTQFISYGNIVSKRYPAQYILRTTSNDGRIQGYAYVTSGGGWRSCTTTTQISLNQWSHVASTYDGTTIKVYINGEESCSRSYAPGPNDSGSAPLMIGAYASGSEYFRGKIDDVVIVQKAMSAEEIKSIM